MTKMIVILVSQLIFLNVKKVWYFLQDTMITEEKVLLPAIDRYYQALVRDIGGKPFREPVTYSQKLEIKLKGAATDARSKFSRILVHKKIFSLI